MSDSEKMSMGPEETADGGVKLPSYYNVGSRRAMLAEMRQAVADRVPIIVVSGEAGVGKSAFCRMGMDDLPEDCIPAYFSRTVESFENVVRSIAEKVGNESVDVSRAGMPATIDRIKESLEGQQIRVVTVFDGAEMIYLATLERIRKMLDRVNEEEVHMQVVLCGRPPLLENLRQLSICNFEEVPEKRFSLGSFEPGDTSAFIEFLSGHHAGSAQGMIAEDGIMRIHQATAGNVAAIYDCAVKLFDGDDVDTVLAGMGGGGASGKRTGLAVTVQKSVRELGTRIAGSDLKKYLPAKIKYSPAKLGVVGALLGIVLLVFVFSGDDSSDVQTPMVEQQEAVQAGAETSRELEAAGKTGGVDTAGEKTEYVAEQPLPEAAQAPVETVELAVDAGAEPQKAPDEPVAAGVTEPAEEHEAAGKSEEPEPISLDAEVIAETQRTEVIQEAQKPVDDVSVEESAARKVEVVQADTGRVEPDTPPPVEREAEVEAVETVAASESQSAAEAVPSEGAMTVPDPGGETEATLVEPDTPLAVARAVEREAETDVTETVPPPERQVVVETMSGDGAITVLEPEKKAEIAARSEAASGEPVGAEVVLLRSEKKKVVMTERTLSGEESSIVISTLSEPRQRDVKVIRNSFAAKKKVSPSTLEDSSDAVKEIRAQTVMVEKPVVEEEPVAVAMVPPPVPVKDMPAGAVEGKTKIRIPVVGAAIVPDFPQKTVPPVPASGDSKGIMAERMAAGRAWLTGAKDDRYTIQLMVLGAEGAENKVAQVLTDGRYAREAGNFYMFRSSGASPSFFVFYGEYRSMTEARNARNSIPPFLKKHRPYVLSIRGAMQKVKGG